MIRRNRKKTARGGLLFLLVVVLVYALAALFNGEAVVAALRFSTGLMGKLLPILLLVFVLIFLSNLVVNPEWIRRHIGKDSGIKGWLVALLGGVLSIGPVYPWYALLGELREKGMRTALTAAFLFARGVKLPLLPLMVHYFGLSFTLVLTAYILLFSLLSGVVMEKVID